MSSILSKIKMLDFPESQYIKESANKIQIVLHHTVSGDNIPAIASWWGKTRQRIATAIIISRGGTPYQIFSSKYWGYHLGIKRSFFAKLGLSRRNLDRTSIGIEIANWGGLKEMNGKYYTCYGAEVPEEKVVKYDTPFRGYSYFEAYTKEQIQTIKELLLLWNARYKIPLDYKEGIWDVSKAAMSGEAGVWSHTSFRSDKSDCHPQKELIEMLKSLKES